MNAREQIIDIVNREFIGPDPLKNGSVQENGEEILKESPLSRYLAGVLYPQNSSPINITESEAKINDVDTVLDHEESEKQISIEEDTEELLNLSNTYLQSAISLTVAIESVNQIEICIKTARYDLKIVENKKCYFRIPYTWKLNFKLPDFEKQVSFEELKIDEKYSGLKLICTYRFSENNKRIYTFTLLNDKHKATRLSESDKKDQIQVSDCFFQTELSLITESGFSPLTHKDRTQRVDEESKRINFLYRNIKNYGIGHGCSAEWEPNNLIREIHTEFFPTYEMKPVVPAKLEGLQLDMSSYMKEENKRSTIDDLSNLCSEYNEWIFKTYNKIKNEIDLKYKKVAEENINDCRECLKRMKKGISILENDSRVFTAFSLMNRAMLLQQLHYNLPIQSWTIEDNNIVLDKKIEKIPVLEQPETWIGDKSRYGKWRPFQIAFILMNIESMTDEFSSERELIDLIWFPTGGGKTEAYLGLSAFTIFYRRLINPNDDGTAVIMRYTLRLLTAQQYERAATLICACELIRRARQDQLGKREISIGLWVGNQNSPNSREEAVKNFNEIYNEKNSGKYQFVITKCPWCGAQIGQLIKIKGKKIIQGLDKKKTNKKQQVSFVCSNSDQNCPFSSYETKLPLYITDEDVYKKTPEIVLGTVDKFAMLPYRPEASRIFGIQDGKRFSYPSLIIQDELHLISGPLGSMVGIYETLISELSSNKKNGKKIKPKIIAATATISHAKEQCSALYACTSEKIKQFPPSGIDDKDSFFAKEDLLANGRIYIGIMTEGYLQNATTMIRLYADLVFIASKFENVTNNERDAYWTNIGYFNSLRELGQLSSWVRADIAEQLKIVNIRYSDPVNKTRWRYISRVEELTSRISGDSITQSLDKLTFSHPSQNSLKSVEDKSVDICLASNMISVGLDISRLGLMTVAGQPKTTAEYIQTTSRVGRDYTEKPGIVFVVYNPTRPRDRSHYENFINYHAGIYGQVEATSVTPFSLPVRERALPAVVIGLQRLKVNSSRANDPSQCCPDKKEQKIILDIILKRVGSSDPDEVDSTRKEILEIFQNWEIWKDSLVRFQDFKGDPDLPLIYSTEQNRNENWLGKGFLAPTSLRSVDSLCVISQLRQF